MPRTKLVPDDDASTMKVSRLVGRIRPIVEVDGNKMYIEQPCVYTQAFLWEPKLSAIAEDMEPIADVKTYHTFGFYGFFKPTIAEVLIQIPECHEKETIAFEIVKSPGTADDLNEEIEALNQGYHVATTRLYRRKAAAG